VLLTFDDGFRNNAETVAPILRRYEIPALFFVSSRHCFRGQYLWFAYLKMIRKHFRGSSISLDGVRIFFADEEREKSLQRLTAHLLALRPHPYAMYEAINNHLPHLEEIVSPEILGDECEGVSEDQVRDLSRDPLFCVGGHTVDHPYLTLCETGECLRQIRENKQWLQRITGKKCDLFAYPLGDFNGGVLQSCQLLGFRLGFGVEWNSVNHPQFGIRRIGVYRKSLAALGIKLWNGHWIPSRLIHQMRSLAKTTT
jgi:peptidoglycan/xylan/chitin deacetylase (PgdA/CDA1 family)